MHNIIQHSIAQMPIDSNRLQRGKVIYEKNGQEEVIVLHFDGEILCKAK